MFSAKSSTEGGKGRPWQSHVKIQPVKPSGGSCFLFFRNGCGDKKPRPSLGPNVEKWGPCHRLTKSNMCREAVAPALVFSKMCVAANVLDWTLNTRRESEVVAMGLENLTCLGWLRHLGHFFGNRKRWQMFSAKSPAQDGRARPLRGGVEIEKFSMSRWPGHKYVPKLALRFCLGFVRGRFDSASGLCGVASARFRSCSSSGLGWYWLVIHKIFEILKSLGLGSVGLQVDLWPSQHLWKTFSF